MSILFEKKLLLESTMNKQELLNEIKRNCKNDVSSKIIEDVFEATLKTITDVTIKEEKLTLFGFGSFTLRNRASRNGVNPKNPTQKIHIPESKTIGFKVSKVIKDQINAK